MLTWTFLGVGSAFAKRNLNSNILIEAWKKGPGDQPAPDDVLLVDFGNTGPIALDQLRRKPGFEYLDRGGTINYPAIRKIFITHQHGDHIGGLEELALVNMFVLNDPQTGRPFKPQLISSISILINLWDNSLKGGLNTLPGRYALLQDYFFILSLVASDPERDHFTRLKRYRLGYVPADHVQIEQKYDWPSYGMFIEDTVTGEAVFFSGDSRFDYPAYSAMIHRAKLCFHDVQLVEQKNSVHALISELRTLPAEIRQRTILYHYGDNWDEGPYDFINEEFRGFATPQERMILFE